MSVRHPFTRTVIDSGYLNLTFVRGNTSQTHIYKGIVNTEGVFGVTTDYLRNRIAQFTNPRNLYLQEQNLGAYFRVYGQYEFNNNSLIAYSRDNARVLCRTGFLASRRLDIVIFAHHFQGGYISSYDPPYYRRRI